MRKDPALVPPIVHNGVKYEAPHWRRGLPLDPGQDAREAREEARMQATLVNVMARQGPADMTPEWIQSTLLEAGHDADLVKRTVEKMTVHRILQEALMKLATSVTQTGAFQASDQSPMGYASEERLRPVLEESGLNPEQIDLALQFLENQKSQLAKATPQDGGYVLATEADFGLPLWCIQVYETVYSSGFEKDDQEVFITDLSLDGNSLLIKDERERTHSLDLETREIRQLK